MRAQIGLRQKLGFGDEFFLAQAQAEALFGLVVLDFRRQVAQLAPAIKDGAHAGAALVGQANAAEGADDAGVAHFLVAGVEQLLARGKGVTGVEKFGLVTEEADDRHAGGVAKVLMDEQVDGGFAEGDVVWRVVVAAHRGHVHAERTLAVAEVELDDGLPRLDEVVFHGDAVGPADGGVVLGAGIAVELHVHRHAWQHLADIFAAAQHEDGGTGGTQHAALLNQEAPVTQEGGVIGCGVPAGVAGGEARAIPAHGGFVEAAAGVHVQRLGIEADVRCVTDEAQQFVAGAGVIATTPADVGFARIALQIHGFFVALGFGHIEGKNRAFSQGMNRAVDGQKHADLVLVAHPAKEGVLDFVGIGDAGDGEGAVGLLDAEHQVPARCVGKGTDGFQRIAGRSPRRFLEFDVAPFDGLELGKQFVSGHGVTRSQTLAWWRPCPCHAR